MDLNFSAIDVLYDSDFLVELEEKFLQFRSRSGRRKDRRLGLLSTSSKVDEQNYLELLSAKRSTVYRSPSTDYEVSNFVYSFLKTQFLASTSRAAAGEVLSNKKSSSLEKILETRQKSGKIKNLIPLQHQTELVLLWLVLGLFFVVTSAIHFTYLP
jgi:hypothetical protein